MSTITMTVTLEVDIENKEADIRLDALMRFLKGRVAGRHHLNDLFAIGIEPEGIHLDAFRLPGGT